MYDFTNFFQAAKENGVFVLGIVIGLNTILGAFSVKGKWQLLSGLLLGLVFGGLFQIAGLGTPVDFAQWFSVVAYGLIMGLTSVGLYETAKKIATKAIATVVAKLIAADPSSDESPVG